MVLSSEELTQTRARKRSILARVAHENGVSVPQLAAAVSQPAATIREWLAEAAERSADDSPFAPDDS